MATQNATDRAYVRLSLLGNEILSASQQLATMKGERSRLIESIRNSVSAGNSSVDPRRDLVFLLFGPENDPVLQALIELDSRLELCLGQLILTVTEKHKPPTPRGGVILESPSYPYQPPPLLPGKTRVLKLGVLNGKRLIVNCRERTCSLPVARFLERRSTVQFGVNGLENRVFPIRLIDSPCPIELQSTLITSQTNDLTIVCGGLPAAPIPPVFIGDGAVTKWMEEHRLHFNTGAIPSPFVGLCEQLDYRLV
ncbi:MAG: hypothetical protein AAB677_00105 [Patescibacteria group bacterium]